MKFKKSSYKFYYITLSVLVFILVIFFYNSENIYKKAFKAFFYFPDKFKSLFMIVTDKRSFSNLYNESKSLHRLCDYISQHKLRFLSGILKQCFGYLRNVISFPMH